MRIARLVLNEPLACPQCLILDARSVPVRRYKTTRYGGARGGKRVWFRCLHKHKTYYECNTSLNHGTGKETQAREEVQYFG